MRKLRRTAKILLAALQVMAVTPCIWAAEQQQDPQPRPEIYFKRLAVAPVLVGHRIPKLDESLDDTLSCKISEICKDDPSIGPDAGPMMTRLVYSTLRHRFGDSVIPMDEVRSAYAGIHLADNRDTPRSLTRRLGKTLSADLVMFGMVWRYRDIGGDDGGPEQPSSVAFVLYLVDAGSGRRIWRGIFSETQEYAFKNMFKFKERIKMGLKWLTADQLARYGVKQTLDKFPTNVIPVAGENGKSGNAK